MLFYFLAQDLSGTDSAVSWTPRCWSYRRCQPTPPSSMRWLEICCNASSSSEVVARTRSQFQISLLSSTSSALKVGVTSVMTEPEVRGTLFDYFLILPQIWPPVGISSILFETRLGCLQEEIPKDTLRFISATNDMLTLSMTVPLFPRWTRNILPFWKRFIQAWDDLYDVGMQQKNGTKLNIWGPNFRFTY